MEENKMIKILGIVILSNTELDYINNMYYLNGFEKGIDIQKTLNKKRGKKND
jgi:hypothetical protein